jgi:hypothetical protein
MKSLALRPSRPIRLATALVGLALLALPAAPAQAAPAVPTPVLLGQVTLPSGSTFQGTSFGGLSGVTYDARRGVYYAISDDRSERNPARFYTLRVDLADGPLQAGVKVLDSTPLVNGAGRPFPALSLDPESITLTPHRTLVISSEGDAGRLVPPFVREFSLTGKQLAAFPLPAYYRPSADGLRGVRTNLALESGGLTANGRHYFTATENALAQDGPAATTTNGSASRLLRYDAVSRRPDGEFVYVVERVAQEPVPAGSFATNGLVDLLPLSANRLLALERGFSTGVGNTVRLYVVDLAAATDVMGRATLPAGLPGIRPAGKTLLLDLGSLGITLDNLEGLTFGPTLPDGRRSLVLVSDDNFSPTQQTQVLAFAL